MHILQPSHNIPATKVKSWRKIKDVAAELRKFTNGLDDTHTGYYKRAFAIHHGQVSNQPVDFFVADETVEEGRMLKELGHWCIINAKILTAELPAKVNEACMSFPFRKEKKVERMMKVKVRYYVPFLNFFLLRRTRTFEGLVAQVFQHEIEHGLGKNIHGKHGK